MTSAILNHLFTALVPEILPPLVTSSGRKVLIIVLAYAITLALSTRVVALFVSPPAPSPDETAPTPEDREHATEERRHLGNVIGKCENVIIVTFILARAETGLALIFAAKALVRRQDIERDPGYFLGGTLINFVWSLAVAMIARLLIAGL